MRSLKAGIYGQAQEEMEAKDAKIKELEDQLAMVSDRARLEVDTHVYFPSARAPQVAYYCAWVQAHVSLASAQCRQKCFTIVHAAFGFGGTGWRICWGLRGPVARHP